MRKIQPPAESVGRPMSSEMTASTREITPNTLHFLGESVTTPPDPLVPLRFDGLEVLT